MPMERLLNSPGWEACWSHIDGWSKRHRIFVTLPCGIQSNFSPIGVCFSAGMLIWDRSRTYFSRHLDWLQNDDFLWRQGLGFVIKLKNTAVDSSTLHDFFTNLLGHGLTFTPVFMAGIAWKKQTRLIILSSLIRRSAVDFRFRLLLTSRKAADN